ncbi:hypothetical protein ACFQFR_04795 [Streptomyces goshikiensis]
MSLHPDPLDYPFWSAQGLDPYPGYPALRERPLARVRLPYGEEAWLATRHEDVRTVLSDPRFSLAEAARRDPPRTTPQVSHLGGLVGNDAPPTTPACGPCSARRSPRAASSACATTSGASPTGCSTGWATPGRPPTWSRTSRSRCP